MTSSRAAPGLNSRTSRMHPLQEKQPDSACDGFVLSGFPTLFVNNARVVGKSLRGAGCSWPVKLSDGDTTAGKNSDGAGGESVQVEPFPLSCSSFYRLVLFSCI